MSFRYSGIIAISLILNIQAISLTMAQSLDISPFFQMLQASSMADKQRLDLIGSALDGKIIVGEKISQGTISPSDVAQLLRFAADIPYEVDAKERTRKLDARKHVFSELGLDKPKLPLKSSNDLFFISAGLLGMNVDQNALLKVISDESWPPQIRVVALEALLKQKSIENEAKDVLIKSAMDPFSYTDSTHIGRPTYRRVYPIRELSYEGLTRLGVKCRKSSVPEKTVDPDAGEVLNETVIVVE